MHISGFALYFMSSHFLFVIFTNFAKSTISLSFSVFGIFFLFLSILIINLQLCIDIIYFMLYTSISYYITRGGAVGSSLGS